jgi:hypothetical protein
LNVYTCRKCGGKTITIDIHDGVTPFMLGCRASGEEGDCNGMAESSFYRVPTDTPPAEWEWFKPEGTEYRKLSREMREHVDKGGLDIRKIGGKTHSDDLKGYYRDSHGSLRREVTK